MEPRIRVAVDRLVSRLLPLYFKVQRSQEPTQGTVVSLLVAQKKLKLKALCTWGREKPAITLSSRPSASEPPGGCIFGISCSQARTHTHSWLFCCLKSLDLFTTCLRKARCEAVKLMPSYDMRSSTNHH